MTPVVLDASFVVALLVPEPNSGEARTCMAAIGTGGLLSLSLLNWEVGNVLRMKLRRKVATASERDQAWTDFADLPLEWDDSGDASDVMSLADRHDLTFYDAAYLELARRLAAPLVTFDQDLRAAAAKEGVPVLP